MIRQLENECILNINLRTAQPSAVTQSKGVYGLAAGIGGVATAGVGVANKLLGAIGTGYL